MSLSQTPPRPIAEIPPEEVRRICAGEVVERPLNVVKELVENAIDSGARNIIVELEEGGRELIRVTDDGSGIPAAELPLALLPHHTSKLTRLEDIFAITSLGFRGEALSSISAVSRLSIASRRAEEAYGTRLQSVGGELLEPQRVNLQRGTVVEVSSLFFNTPVRLKFLRSRSAETAQVSSLLSAYALAYPEVSFRLSSAGRLVLRSDGDGNGEAVLADLIGHEARGMLVPINFEFPPSAARGLVSDPALHRPNRSRQWFFVNRRPVNNKLLYKAVDDAVREFMSEGKYPAGAFFLDLPPEEIDVNVHPMKSEVNFAQPQAVYSLLVTAIRRALGSHAQLRQQQLSAGLAGIIRPRLDGPGPKSAQAANPLQREIPLYDIARPFVQPSPDMQAFEGINYLPGETLPSGNNAPRPASMSLAAPLASPAELNVDLSVAGPESMAGPESSPGSMTLEDAGKLSVRQVADSYLVVTSEEAVYLVDQHAAHERILFESIYESFERQLAEGPARQKLLFPLVLGLTEAESALAEEYLPALRALGFACESGAGPSLVVHEVPLLLARRMGPELLRAVLDELAQGHPASTSLDTAVKELAASIACRAAVKAGHRLTEDERADLVRQLLARWSSLSCPHGRPTILRLGPGELEKLFLRDKG